MTLVLASVWRTISVDDLLFKPYPWKPTHPQAGSEMPTYVCRKFSYRIEFFPPWILPNFTYDFISLHKFLQNLPNFCLLLKFPLSLFFQTLSYLRMEPTTYLSCAPSMNQIQCHIYSRQSVNIHRIENTVARQAKTQVLKMTFSIIIWYKRLNKEFSS